MKNYLTGLVKQLFVVIQEKMDVKHQQQINVDTRKKSWVKDFKCCVELLVDIYITVRSLEEI